MAIIGKLGKVEKFFSGSPQVASAFAYLKAAADPSTKEHQRIFSSAVGTFRKAPLENGLFALEQVFMTKGRNECFVESHQKYVDLQLLLSGEELMEYVDIDSLSVKSPYDPVKDLITYHDTSEVTKILLKDGDIAIFFPEDAHVGIQQYLEPVLVYKTVVKVPLGCFNAISM